MARLKHLLVALLTAGAGLYYLHARAEAEGNRIRALADERLKSAPAAVAGALATDGQALLAQLKGIPFGAIAEAMDDEGKPTAEALEAARNAIDKGTPSDAERPALVVIAAQGVGGRFRTGISNRFDRDLQAFPALGGGPLPRAGIGMLDGELFRYGVTQFEDTKVPDAKGLLAIAYPLDDGLARKLQSAAGGADVAVLNKDKVVGNTLPPAERQALQAVVPAAKGTFDFGSVAGQAFGIGGLPLPLFMKPVRYHATIFTGANLPADIKILVATRTLDAFATIGDDQKAVLALLGFLVLASLLLMIFAGDPARGLSRVVSAAEKLAQGEREARAPTDKMTALVRRAAVAINSIAGQVGAGAAVQAPSFAEQLGIKPGRSPSQAAQPPNELPEESPAPSPTNDQAGLADVDSFLSTPPRHESATTIAPPPAAPAARTGTSGFGSSASFASPAPGLAKPKPTTAPPPQYEPPSDSDFGHDRTVIAQTPDALIRATQRSTNAPSPISNPPLSAAVPLPPPAAGNEEAHFQQVFKDFVATREKCKEPADGLTFEKFAQKLRKNQEQLVQKYQCRTVRFQVYVKDGKAALKATPVR